MDFELIIYQDAPYARINNSEAVPVGRLESPSDIGGAMLWLAELKMDTQLVALVSGAEVLRQKDMESSVIRTFRVSQ